MASEEGTTARLGRSEGNTIPKAVKAWNSPEEHLAAAQDLEELERRARLAEQGGRSLPPDREA